MTVPDPLPHHVTLKQPVKLIWWFCALGGAPGALFAFMAMTQTTPLEGLFTGLFCAICAAAGAHAILFERRVLDLGREGFVERVGRGACALRWEETEPFFVWEGGGLREVGYWRAGADRPADGFPETLNGTYRRDAADLAALLNAFRQRALEGASPHR